MDREEGGWRTGARCPGAHPNFLPVAAVTNSQLPSCQVAWVFGLMVKMLASGRERNGPGALPMPASGQCRLWEAVTVTPAIGSVTHTLSPCLQFWLLSLQTGGE